VKTTDLELNQNFTRCVFAQGHSHKYIEFNSEYTVAAVAYSAYWDTTAFASIFQILFNINRMTFSATRLILCALNMLKCVCAWGPFPDTTGGANSALPDSLAGFEGLLCGREKGKGRKKGGNTPKINVCLWLWLFSCYDTQVVCCCQFIGLEDVAVPICLLDTHC